MPQQQMTVRHPAKFSDPIIEIIGREIPEGSLCLDPFAGVGKIFDIVTHCDWTGLEIEKEWSDLHPLTICGDIFKDIPDWWSEFFDIVATSTTYGSRMADHHDARDGSERHSYKHDLGRDLSKNNSGQIHWGDQYRKWHRAAWPIILDTLRPGGKFIANLSNHIRDGEEQHVWEWHFNFFLHYGLKPLHIHPVNTRRMRKGKNYQARVNCEYVFVFEK